MDKAGEILIPILKTLLKMKPSQSFTILLTMLLLITISSAQQEFTNKEGKKIRAEIMNASESEVTLKRERDGKKFTIQLNTLSIDGLTAVKAWIERRRKAWLRLPASKRYSITPAKQDGISLRYEDFLALKQKEEAKAQNEMTSKERLKARIGALPKGGIIIITVKRSTIGAANTKYFLAIVTDENDQEITRKQGASDVANTPSRGDGLWWNLLLVNLPKDIKSGIKVRVVDKLDNEASDFTITPKKEGVFK